MYGRGNRCLLHKPGRCGEGLAMGPGSKAELHTLGRLRRCACSLRASPRSQAATPRRCWAPAENSGSRRAPLACSEATAPLRCNGVHFSLQSPGVSRDLRNCLSECARPFCRPLCSGKRRCRPSRRCNPQRRRRRTQAIQPRMHLYHENQTATGDLTKCFTNPMKYILSKAVAAGVQH